MRVRSQSKRRWIWIIDVIAALLMFGAFYVFASTALYAIVGTFGEFGPSPCDCEELESELESIDWLGTGQGIRFRTPGIVDEVFQEEGLEFEASQWGKSIPRRRRRSSLPGLPTNLGWSR